MCHHLRHLHLTSLRPVLRSEFAQPADYFFISGLIEYAFHFDNIQVNARAKFYRNIKLHKGFLSSGRLFYSRVLLAVDPDS